MKAKRYQVQNLQRTLRQNSTSKFSPNTAMTIADISTAIDPIVVELEKELIELRDKFIKVKENGEQEFDMDGYRKEAEPILLADIEVPGLPETLTIEYKQTSEFTADFFRHFKDLYGNKISFKSS